MPRSKIENRALGQIGIYCFYLRSCRALLFSPGAEGTFGKSAGKGGWASRARSARQLLRLSGASLAFRFAVAKGKSINHEANPDLRFNYFPFYLRQDKSPLLCLAGGRGLQDASPEHLTMLRLKHN